MAKFVIVNQAPEKLESGEIVISAPDFLEQIRENAAKAPRGGLTGVNQLRYIVGSIGQKYDPEGTNAWSVRPTLFEGRAYANEAELSAIVVEMLKSQHPKIFDKYLDYQIKSRPQGTKLIYFVGPLSQTTSFFQHGVDMLDPKDVDVYMGRKQKRVVGKPAVTNEEAKELSNE